MGILEALKVWKQRQACGLAAKMALSEVWVQVQGWLPAPDLLIQTLRGNSGATGSWTPAPRRETWLVLALGPMSTHSHSFSSHLHPK